MSLEIRKAVTTDADSLAEIMNEAHRFKLAKGDMAWKTEPFTQKDMMHTIRKSTGYLAAIDGNPVARFVLDWVDKDGWGDKGLDGQAGYVHALAVRDAYRGQHLGEQIMACCFDHIRNAGRSYARLDCPTDNAKLCAYYENQSFIRMATNDHGHALCERLV